MIDKRIGKRIKQRREQIGLTQEQFAEKLGVAPNNGLETSADAIFCDVIDHTTEYRASVLSRKLQALPPADQKRILEIVEFMVQQAENER